ncbi:beta-class carbonic anhydrase [Caloranaerobacter ferrireducens]|uniref:beta-class carbonic anhydrase n=1 Tax=Caloranaerobacter ferrireducens TaxID=1323370 RepID=UPI00084D577E|nr:carbonic anhydrase [Caloranaerobacter ferrireducens]
MQISEKILDANKKYVKVRRERRDDKPISSHAQKEILIFTCMDTRLVGLVEEAMGFKRGEVKVLKNAGNSIRDNCDDVIRSISLGTIMMGLKEVFVVGHKDCGMAKQSLEDIRNKMLERGVPKEAIDSIDLANWTGIIKDEKENVIQVVKKIKNSPFVPKDVKVHGFLIDPNSGELEVIINDNE